MLFGRMLTFFSPVDIVDVAGDESSFLLMQYLVNPNGGFVTFYGKNFTPDRMAKSIVDIVRDWARENPEYSGMREKGKIKENL